MSLAARNPLVFALLVGVAALALSLSGGPASARIPDLDPAELEDLSTALVEGTVLDVTFVQRSTANDYVKTEYQARVKVTKVERGALSVGDVIVVPFSQSQWAPSEPTADEPCGPQSPSALYPCETFRAYLDASADGKLYWIVYPNGKTALEPPQSYTLPEGPGQTVACEGK